MSLSPLLSLQLISHPFVIVPELFTRITYSESLRIGFGASLKNNISSTRIKAKFNDFEYDYYLLFLDVYDCYDCLQGPPSSEARTLVFFPQRCSQMYWSYRSYIIKRGQILFFVSPYQSLRCRLTQMSRSRLLYAFGALQSPQLNAAVVFLEPSLYGGDVVSVLTR